MKIVIAGAGACGAVMARFLAARGKVKSLVCVDRSFTTLRQLWPKRPAWVKTRRLDLSKPAALAAVLKNADLFVNAASIRLNLTLMNAALKAGVHYQDLSSQLEDGVNLEQLQLAEKFENAGLTALICAGVAPGITSLAAAHLAEGFGSPVDMKIRFLEDQQGTDLMFPWSPEIALEDCFIRPVEYRNKRWVRPAPLSGEEIFKFPGRPALHLVRIYGEEAATLPKYLSIKSIDVKSGGSDIEEARRMWANMPNRKNWRSWVKRQGLKTPEPKKLVAATRNGTMVNAWFSFVVEVRGRHLGKIERMTATAVFPDYKTLYKNMPGASYIAWATGLSAALFAEQVPGLGLAGVFPPEVLPARVRNQIFKELRKAGVKLSVKSSA